MIYEDWIMYILFLVLLGLVWEQGKTRVCFFYNR